MGGAGAFQACIYRTLAMHMPCACHARATHVPRAVIRTRWLLTSHIGAFQALAGYLFGGNQERELALTLT